MKNRGLGFLLPYMKPYRGVLIIGTLYALIGAGASAFRPTLLGWSIDSLNVDVQSQTLTYYALGILGLSAILALFRFLLRMLTGNIAAGITYRMSQDLFHRLLLFDKETRQGYGTGDLLSRATSDFIYIWRFYSAGFQMTIHALFLLIIGCGLMAMTSMGLAVLVMALLITSIVIQVRLGRLMEHSFAAVQREMAYISAFAQEHLHAARMLRAYAQETVVGKAFRHANDRFVTENLKFVIRSGAISPIPGFAVRAAMTVIVLIGGLMIIRNQATVGQYSQFIFYLVLLNQGAQQITGAFERLQQGAAAAGRIGEILHRYPKISDKKDALDIPLEGHIRFENVGIQTEEDRWAVRHIDLDIEVGTTIGIVGPTGAGKSMLLSLLGRIYDPNEGRIFLDGIDLRDIKLAALRRSVVYVPQETLLFTMPLRGNIALGVPNMPQTQIQRAMQQSRLVNDLPQLPKGLDSLVGEKGATLSGGQRQRTAIARALVRNPTVLLLDDALASVDTRTSAEILNELQTAGTQRTVIIVSQRMAAIQDADTIVVLDEGRIVEQGNHNSLMALNDRYAEMYRRELEEPEPNSTGQ